MPLRFQNVCRHRQTNNTSRLPPILTLHTLFSHFPAPLLSNFPAFPENLLPAVSCRPAPHTLFPHLSCPASFKLSRLSRKSPAGRFTPPRTAHVVSSPFLPRFFQTFPPFPKISCQPSSADPHTARVVFSLSCPASFKLSRLSRKSHAGCLPPILAPHTLFSHFPAPLLSNFPAFPENLLPAVSRRPAPHALFPHLSCRASFKLSRLSRKSPAGRLPPILTLHALFPHLSCRASFKLSRLSRKSPAGRLPPILTLHALFPCFPVLFTAPLPDVFVSSF